MRKPSVTDIASSFSSTNGAMRPGWDTSAKFTPAKMTNRPLRPDPRFNQESPEQQAADDARRMASLLARQQRLESQRTLFIAAAEGVTGAKLEVASTMRKAERQQLAELAVVRSAEADVEVSSKAAFNAEHAASSARDFARSHERRTTARDVGQTNLQLAAEAADRRRRERQQRIEEERALLAVSDGRPGSPDTYRSRYR